MRTLLLLLLICLPLRAEDWTVDGKDYHNVKVGQIEADRVHITYDGGLGTVPLADLPPELQKRFAYDPAAAKAAQTKREADQGAADAQLAEEVKQQTSQPPTFEDKVEALKAQRRQAIEKEIKACQGFLEQTEVDIAASASDRYRVANLQTYEAYLQKTIKQDQAKLANLQ